MRFTHPLAVIGLVALSLAPMPGRASGEAVVVFAAASLTNALDAVAASWRADTGQVAIMSYGGSSALAKQIQAGAPADIFISASADWMDAVVASGDIKDGTRLDLLGNSLVLIAHGKDAAPVTIDAGLDLVAMLDGGRLSMALVDAVPAGIYGKAALTSLGLWAAVQPLVAQSDNVRSALAFVAQGEAPLGIVYATDAAVSDNVTVIGTFPPESHPPITYPAAITAQSTHPLAADFLAYLSSEKAMAIWMAAGFGLPE